MGTPLKSKKKAAWKHLDMGQKLPKTGSTALLGYLVSYRQINAFLRFVPDLVAVLEHNATRAHKTLVEVEDDPARKAQLIEAWQKRSSPLEDLKKHRQFFMEVILVRHVENYLNYLSSLLMEIFLSRPEALRSSEKIDLETVLRHDSIDDLVRTVSERKVESLSYSSYGDLAQYFREKFHIALASSSDEAVIVEAIETRNVSVHNRCIVNQRYVSRTGSDPQQIGKTKELGVRFVEEVAIVLANCVKATDKDARKRLGVQGHRSRGAK